MCGLSSATTTRIAPPRRGLATACPSGSWPGSTAGCCRTRSAAASSVSLPRRLVIIWRAARHGPGRDAGRRPQGRDLPTHQGQHQPEPRRQVVAHRDSKDDGQPPSQPDRLLVPSPMAHPHNLPPSQYTAGQRKEARIPRQVPPAHAQTWAQMPSALHSATNLALAVTIN